MVRSPSRAPARVRLVLALALLAATLTVAPGAVAATYPNVERIPGSDAVTIGINVSRSLFADGAADAVVLTRDDTFPDGMAASALAADKHAPILFTATQRLADATAAELQRVLTPGATVYLLGGEEALTPGVEQEVRDLGYETYRFAGADRLDTAALIATDPQGIGHAGPTHTAFVVRAYGVAGHDADQGWVDSVSCGAYAAAKGVPVLLTHGPEDGVRDVTKRALEELGVGTVLLCGGVDAIPQSHQEDLASSGYAVRRYFGSTRVYTATDVATRLWGYATTSDKPFIVVPGFGTAFAFGIAASQLAGDLQAPVLLVDHDEPTTQPDDCGEPADHRQETLCYLARNATIASLTVVGSATVISDDVLGAAAEAGGLEADDAPPSVPAGVTATDTPEDDGTQVDVAWDASTEPNGPVTYTVYQRPAGEQTWTTVGETTDTSRRVTGLEPDTAYEFAIDARDRFGNTSQRSQVASATPTDEVPAAPATGPHLSPQASAIVVAWDAAPEADVARYRLQRAVQGLDGSCDDGVLPGDEYADLATVEHTDTDRFSYADQTGSSGEDYCYRYRVEDTTDNASDWSPPAGPATMP